MDYGDDSGDDFDEIQFGESMDGSMSLSNSASGTKGGGAKGGGGGGNDPYNFDISGGPMKGGPPFAFSGGLGGSKGPLKKGAGKATPYTSKSLNFGNESGLGGMRRSRDSNQLQNTRGSMDSKLDQRKKEEGKNLYGSSRGKSQLSSGTSKGS
jgi:hypothetical protein